MATMSLQLKQAIALAKAGKNDQARLLVEKTIEEEPDNVNAWLLLSTLAVTQEEKVQSLNRVLAIDPDHSTARKRLSKIAPILPEEETEEVGALFKDETVVAEMADMVDEVTDELPATVITSTQPSQDDMDLVQEGAIDESPVEPDKSFEGARDSTPAEHTDQTAIESPEDAQLPVADEPEDEALATVISPVVVDKADKDEEGAQEGHIQEDVEPLPETVVSATRNLSEEVIGELQPKTSNEETLEMPDEDLEGLVSIGEPSVDLPDLDNIPEWLRDEGGYAEPGAGMRVTPSPVEKSQEASPDEEIPGWLQEEPDEDLQEESRATTHDEETIDTHRKDERDLRASIAGAVAPVVDEDLEEHERREGPRFSTRTLEIVLTLLIILALLIVAALAYVVLYLG